LILILGNSLVISQSTTDTIVFNNENSVALATKHYGDSIVLRWAPMTPENWVYGMNYGYEVARKDMSDVTNPYEVIQDTLMRWTQVEIENWYTSHPEDEALALPMKTMYQEWENTTYREGDFAELLDRSQYFKQIHQMTLLGSDMFPIVATASGLRFVDSSIDKEKTYSYRVRINYKDTGFGAYSVVRKSALLDKPMLFEAKEKEGHIVITWDRTLHDKVYTAYHIERSLDGENWTRLTDNPYVQAIGEGLKEGRFMSYLDRVENYTLYYYRLIGIDAFGDISKPSDALLAQGKDRTPPVVKKPITKKSEDGDIHMITWSHADMDELRQAIIYRKNVSSEEVIYNSSVDGKWDFDIEDDNIKEGTNLYHVILVDTAGNYAQSQPAEIYIQDVTPPLPPENIKAKVDTSGSVYLTWDQGPDLDVIGYYIFTAPRKHDNYIKLNQKKYLYRVYEDTINMTLLNDKRYYKICAIDKGGNVGELSEALEVQLPDKIPPAPCLFYDYRVDSAGVYLGLMTSSSRDVENYRLYRKKQKENDWEVIKEFGDNPPEIYLDNTIASGGRYVYKWIAVDHSGLESSSEHSKIFVTAHDIRTFYRPQLKIEKSEDGNRIIVSKDIPGENYRIQIVRAKNEGTYRTLTTLKGETEFFDGNGKIKEGEKVKYRAKILYKDGKRSKFSKEYIID